MSVYKKRYGQWYWIEFSYNYRKPDEGESMFFNTKQQAIEYLNDMIEQYPLGVYSFIPKTRYPQNFWTKKRKEERKVSLLVIVLVMILILSYYVWYPDDFNELFRMILDEIYNEVEWLFP